jgi:hypothetical protein
VRPALARRERHPGRHRHGNGTQHLPGGDVVTLGLRQPEDETDQRHAQQHRPREVDVLPVPARPVGWDGAQGQVEAHHRERDVDQQHRTPAGRGEHAADRRSQSSGHGGRPAHRAQRTPPFLRRECRAEQGDRARQHQRPACPLGDPREQEKRKARRHAPDGRRSGEHRQPEQEDPATAEEVAEAAAEHEQTRER